MDLDLLVLLLIFLAPLLQRLFGKKQPQKDAPQRGASPQDASPQRGPPETAQPADDPLGEALRQIREALGDPPEAKPLPEAPPPVAAPTGEFHGLGEFEHEAHGFGRENPISEEVFEQRPAFRSRDETERIEQESLGAVDLTTPLEVDSVDEASGTGLDHLLRDPRRVREAFVLKEILDAPRSRRRLR